METIKSNKSITRLFRQLFHVPAFSAGWLTNAAKQQLTQKITHAEKGHRGEIYLIIENTLPLLRAFSLTPRKRAVELFAQHSVWDTQDNTGVLVYVNICEHDLEIVADRGISAHVDTRDWQVLCDQAIEGIRAGQYTQSIGELITKIGDLLLEHYPLSGDPEGNELSDNVLHL